MRRRPRSPSLRLRHFRAQLQCEVWKAAPGCCPGIGNQGGSGGGGGSAASCPGSPSTGQAGQNGPAGSDGIAGNAGENGTSAYIDENERYFF